MPSPVATRMPGALRAAAVKRRLLRALLSWKAPTGLDITTIRRVPEAASYPIRRQALDPVPELAATRELGPVVRLAHILGLDVWLVAGHEQARSVLADATGYSNDLRHLLGSRRRSEAEGVGGLGMTDPPDHTRLRRLLTPEFTMRRLARLAPLVDTVVTDALDAMEAAGPEADLVADFGFAVPFGVICELLGLPEADRAAFHELGAARFDLTRGGMGSFGAAKESRTFLIDAVRRQRAHPGEGMIGAMLRGHGAEFDDVELGGLADGVFLGGYETSASMLSLGGYVLMSHREAFETVRTGTDSEVDAVVEELLRYLCPVQVAFPRFARADHELFGQHVRAGDVVVVSLVGGNRDPRFAADPDVFDPTRPGGGHLAFGHGLHRCVGAELARMELRSALRGLTRRFPELALAAEPGELAFRELSAVYGVDRLPVRLRSGG